MMDEYHYRMDRGRVPIPPCCRQEFQRVSLAYNRHEGCIEGRPSITGLPLDARGRIGIKRELREEAGIQDSLVILATEGHLEFWGAMNWHLEEALATAEAHSLS